MDLGFLGMEMNFLLSESAKQANIKGRVAPTTMLVGNHTQNFVVTVSALI